MAFVWREALAGLRRNITMSVAMVLTTAISLGLLGAGLLAVRTIDRTQDLYYSQLAVQVALDEPTSAADRRLLAPDLHRPALRAAGRPARRRRRLREPRCAYQRFLRIYAGQSILQLVRPQACPRRCA